MMKNHYSTWSVDTTASTTKRLKDYVVNGILKRSKSSVLMLFITLFSFAYSFGQTTLISPTGDGGFENGATFAANGWTAVNAATDGWNVGNVPVVATGTNCGYVSANGGAAWTYSQLSTVTHIYKDFTVPAGENKITLSFKWKAGGEGTTTSDWDNLKVFVASSSFVPTTVAVTGQTQLSGAGATSGMYKLNSATWNSETITFSGTPGTTYRLIFSWKSDVSTIVDPPAAVDDISLVSSAPGNFISIATGNWGTATTWDANAVPTNFDNVTVSTGDVVTINAANQTSNNLIVNGTLVFGATPTTFAIIGNLTVNTGGTFNVFNGIAGKTVSVLGNIINDGTIDLSVGTGANGNLTLSGTTVQTVSGTGTFNTGVIRNLIFSNTSTAIPNIIWSFNNIAIANNLNLTGAKINLGANKLTFGNNAAGGTLTAPVGTGFLPGGKFSRWWTATATGSAIAAGTDPSNTTSRYPFINATGQNRAMYITRTNATGAVAGELAVTYNDASTVTTGLSILDGAYTVTDRYDGNWSVSNEGTAVSASSYSIALLAQGAYLPTNGNSRIVGAATAISGTHQNGTTTPGAQRTTVSQADLLAAPLYLGIDGADIPFISATNGDWNNATTWNKGTVPVCANAIIIANGTNVTVNSAANVSKSITINLGGTLTVASGDLTVGCTLNNNSLTNNGTLTVSGGTLAINGNLNNSLATSTFNQSGGVINIDGNNAGLIASSVASGTPLFNSKSNNVTLSGGILTFVDPHVATTLANSVTFFFNTTSWPVSTLGTSSTHVTQFGDGVSTDAGGTANGFYINTWEDAGFLALGKIIVNGGTIAGMGTNRALTSKYNVIATGDVVVYGNGILNFGIPLYIGGNLSVNAAGSFTNTSTVGTILTLYPTTTGLGPVTNPQTITNNGIFNTVALTINNSNATGVTLNSSITTTSTLTLTEGFVNTTNTNLLTLGSPALAGTLVGGSNTAYIKGPFARTIASSNTAMVLYPVGKSTYSPISIAPTTTTVSVMKAEEFDSNTGTADAAITNLSTNRRWEVALVSGTFTDINVRVADAALTALSVPVQAPSASGIYTSTFGSVATFVAGTPNTTQSNNAITSANFTGFLSFAESNVCSGTPAPGNTIPSASTICLGETVVLSVQNTTPGIGVTYQWQSSTDGVLYTDIVGATSATLSATPATALYYQNVITCSTGPASGTTTPVQINFSSSITASTPAARCGTGTVVLAATPSAGATVNWYENQIGGLKVGTGSNFTTPSINATTTYYAGADAVSTGSIALGAGTTPSSSTGNSFLPGAWGGAKTQYIIRASELVASGLSAGSITSLGFQTTNSGQTYTGFNVYVGSTASTVAPAVTFIDNAGLTKVYGGTLANEGYLPIANALNTLTFGTGAGASSTFNWDGTSNIVVSISWSTVPNSGTSISTTILGDNVGFAASAYRQRDNLAPAVMLAETSVNSTGLIRPRFTINGQVVCQSPRTAVVATVTVPPAVTLSTSSAPICNGQSTPTVTLTAGSTDYDTYTWSPATGVSGDPVSGYVFNPTTTTTYTLTATQTTGSLCATTVNFVVNVNALPSALTVTPATATVCENGIQMLTATGGIVGVSGKVGSGTSINTTSTPFKAWFGGSKTQALYTAAELTSMGMLAGEKINSIGYVALTGTPIVMNNFTISAGFVSTSTLGTAFISGANNTVLAPTAYTAPTGTGNLDFALSTPLTWDGTSNLLVETCFNNNNGGATSINSISVESSTVALGLNSYLSQDNNATVCSNVTAPTTTTTRPNLRISTLESTNITWSPVTNLYTDAAALVAYVGGTNASTVYVKSATAGTNAYTASATNPSTLCASTATANVIVNAPTTNSTTETACGTYTWAVNGTVYNTSGTYTVVTGCATEILVLTITPSTSTLTTETACGTYTWAINGIAYTTSGTYTKVTGCNVDSLVLTINTIPVATVTRTGDNLNVNATSGATYQWVKCDGSFTAIVGATSASYQATALGQYAVKVTKNGCTTTSACFDVTTLDVKSLEVANLNLYPNPVTDVLTVTYTKNITGVEVYDMTGRLIKNIKMNANEVLVDMSEMPASIYIVKVIAENAVSEFRVVKD